MKNTITKIDYLTNRLNRADKNEKRFRSDTEYKSLKMPKNVIIVSQI